MCKSAIAGNYRFFEKFKECFENFEKLTPYFEFFWSLVLPKYFGRNWPIVQQILKHPFPPNPPKITKYFKSLFLLEVGSLGFSIKSGRGYRESLKKKLKVSRWSTVQLFCKFWRAIKKFAIILEEYQKFNSRNFEIFY